MITPILKKLTTNYKNKTNILKLNINKNPSTTTKYKIINIPTLIIFKNNQPINKIINFQPKKNLTKILNKHL